jgi:hypothetical protein
MEVTAWAGLTVILESGTVGMIPLQPGWILKETIYGDLVWTDRLYQYDKNQISRLPPLTDMQSRDLRKLHYKSHTSDFMP